MVQQLAIHMQMPFMGHLHTNSQLKLSTSLRLQDRLLPPPPPPIQGCPQRNNLIMLHHEVSKPRGTCRQH